MAAVRYSTPRPRADTSQWSKDGFGSRNDSNRGARGVVAADVLRNDSEVLLRRHDDARAYH
jgi:hypothetical protein